MREQNEKAQPPMTDEEKMRNTTFDYLWSTLGVSSLSDITGWAKDANNGGKYYLMIKGRLAEAGDSFTQEMFSTLKTMMDECGRRFFHYSAPTSEPSEEGFPF